MSSDLLEMIVIWKVQNQKTFTLIKKLESSTYSGSCRGKKTIWLRCQKSLKQFKKIFFGTTVPKIWKVGEKSSKGSMCWRFIRQHGSMFHEGSHKQHLWKGQEAENEGFQGSPCVHIYLHVGMTSERYDTSQPASQHHCISGNFFTKNFTQTNHPKPGKIWGAPQQTKGFLWLGDH